MKIRCYIVTVLLLFLATAVELSAMPIGMKTSRQFFSDGSAEQVSELPSQAYQYYETEFKQQESRYHLLIRKQQKYQSISKALVFVAITIVVCCLLLRRRYFFRWSQRRNKEIEDLMNKALDYQSQLNGRMILAQQTYIFLCHKLAFIEDQLTEQKNVLSGRPKELVLRLELLIGYLQLLGGHVQISEGLLNEKEAI